MLGRELSPRKPGSYSPVRWTLTVHFQGCSPSACWPNDCFLIRKRPFAKDATNGCFWPKAAVALKPSRMSELGHKRIENRMSHPANATTILAGLLSLVRFRYPTTAAGWVWPSNAPINCPTRTGRGGPTSPRRILPLPSPSPWQPAERRRSRGRRHRPGGR